MSIIIIRNRDGNEPNSLSRAFYSVYIRLSSARLVYYKSQKQPFEKVFLDSANYKKKLVKLDKPSYLINNNNNNNNNNFILSNLILSRFYCI